MSNTFATQLVWRTARTRLSLSILSRRLGTGNHVGSSKDPLSGFSRVFTDKLASVAKQFDNVLGIAEVRGAQSVVQGAEDEFLKSRRSVYDGRTELVRLQTQLRELRGKLDRIPREDERYLQLATEEHKVLIEERKLKLDLEGFVAVERDNFGALSAAVRNAHEKERSRAERTKYWSIIGSACGAVLGILGSTIINIRRMKQIKLTVQENNQAFMANTMEELKTIFQSEEMRITPLSENKTESSLPTISKVQLTDNCQTSGESSAKPEKMSDLDFNSMKNILATAIRELKQEISEKRHSEFGQSSNLEDPSTFVDFERSLHDVSWWTKASVAASLASVSCSLILCAFYR